ncbi:MAG TPA: cytochrome P450 [Rugosimonospora sp.]|nr:cytochrome P450 [Rugosimonospora sp.]
MGRANDRRSGIDTRGIPHPPRRVPLLGDVLGISRTTPVQDTVRLGRGLGPIYCRRFLNREVVVITGAELMGDLADESRFAKRLAPGVAALRLIGGDGLFTAHNDEPNWRLAHDILLPAFSQSAMRAYHPTMLAATRQLIAAWDSQVDGGPVDVTPDMTKLTLQTIGLSGFGYDFGSFERAEPHPFVLAMFGALLHGMRLAFRLPVVGRLRDLGADRQFRADVQLMTGVVDDVIRARQASGDAGTQDLLGMMLNARHPTTGEQLDPVNIRNQVITFLVAGHETTSGALSFALYYLAHHPEVLARAQAEVDAVWGEQDDPDPTFEQIGKLRYVRRVLDETLRLWPTAPGFAREARQDTVLGGRYPMSAGDWVLVIAPLLHRDPVWGDNVDSFDPDRFTPERVRARPGHAYKPFGTGERACIGRQFATHEALLALGLLLHRFEFTPDPAYQLRVTELLTFKPEGFTLRFTRRRPTPAVSLGARVPSAGTPTPG